MTFCHAGLLVIAVLCSSFAVGQVGPGQGRSIGSVKVRGDLIVLTLDEGVLGRANLFNLAHRTLRFVPDGSRYRVENLPLQWDPDFGSQMDGSQASLRNFSFPFSGRK